MNLSLGQIHTCQNARGNTDNELYTPLELPTEIVSISDQGVASLNKVVNQTTAINMK